VDVSRETFKCSDGSTQNLILFDSILEVGNKLDAFHVTCESRHDCLDKKVATSGKINKAMAAGSGFLGGFIAVITGQFFLNR